MKVKSESEVTQSCPILCDPMDCSLPGSSVHGIFQARVLEWGAIAFSVEEVGWQVNGDLSPTTRVLNFANDGPELENRVFHTVSRKEHSLVETLILTL